ncbi:hypothetical protein CBW65_11640 [Tumebacillus avium]|uniref:Uncharacterized protein n=1 Tax=Tumebacillus avium TaxID=1903704 RepID=A0A1Y0ING7_9BACL|nr:hypothetical protein [Tumebacillus avium]ARU61589.1 hypothetical protein CBW65_11640 [Tumebacillus avium]
MNFMLIAGTIVIPLVLFFLRARSFAWIFDLLGAVALLLFLLTSGLSILEIKQMKTEFTTHIHEIFNSLLFLASSGYLGVYALYRLLLTTAQTRKNGHSR